MRPYDVILKKRNGEELSAEEINFIVEGYVKGEIEDYQMSALAMAIYFQGMVNSEIIELTKAMIKTGDTVDLSSIPGIKVDKHSTGGVGDKTSLVLVPLVAAAEVNVAKMSGRGLGHTGGTIDKLESIPGLQVNLNNSRFLEQVRTIGAAIAAQTLNLVPADKKLYALRDVTATVDSIPLIASSVMSKKLASGADVIVLDVKVGKGAFMRELSSARELARIMVSIGNELRRKTVAFITSMEEPLGYAVGNSLEVKEAVDTLQAKGPGDLTKLCVKLGGQMLYLANKVKTPSEGEHRLEGLLHNGQALRKFFELINAQGGFSLSADDIYDLPEAKEKLEVKAVRDGVIIEIDSLQVGIAAMTSGAGRAKKEDTIDHGAGILLLKKTGEIVRSGDNLAVIYASTYEQAQLAQDILKQAIKVSEEAKKRAPLIYEIIES